MFLRSRSGRREALGLGLGVFVGVCILAISSTAGAADFTFGSPGAADGQFNNATGVATAPSGDVYVADRGNGRVQRFDADGKFKGSWPVPCVWGIAADSSGVYVTTVNLPPSPGSCQDVIKFSPSGTPLWTSTAVAHPFYIASNGSTVFVSRQAHLAGGTWGISRLQSSDGASAGPDWLTGSGANPTALATAANGGLIYVDMSGKAVLLNSSGAPTGTEVSVPGNRYWAPVALASDSEGNVYWGWGSQSGPNFLPAHISVFSANLEPVADFAGSLSSGNYDPMGLAVSPDSLIYMGYLEKGKVEVLDPKNPDPNLNYVPTPGHPTLEPWLVGDPLTLQLTTRLRLGSIGEIAWDLDGNGSFEASGNSETAKVTFDSMGEKTVRARVTTSLGKTSTAEFSTFAYPKPLGPDVGVSINDGEMFANDPNVTLHLVWPGGATGGRVANDGGFSGAKAFSLKVNVPWTIASSGPERLPKTVYVRFQSSSSFPGVDPTKTFQDDIILDETSPKVMSASLSGASSSAAMAKARSYSVRTRARDATSGVAFAQVASNKKKPLKAQKYETKLRVKTASRPRWVRVQDHAGNWSTWKKLK